MWACPARYRLVISIWWHKVYRYCMLIHMPPVFRARKLCQCIQYWMYRPDDKAFSGRDRRLESVPLSGSDIVLIAATASGRVMCRGVTHFSGGRRVTGSDWSKGLRSAGFVPWSLSSFCMEPNACATACEIWRRRRACQAESTPRSFLHAYLCARSSGDVHAHIAYGMWMRWVNFPCKSLALLGLYTRY